MPCVCGNYNKYGHCSKKNMFFISFALSHNRRTKADWTGSFFPLAKGHERHAGFTNQQYSLPHEIQHINPDQNIL